MATGSRRALVVGGGPAGTLSAITLANRGYKVDLVEKSLDSAQFSDTLTYVILLSPRGLKALRHAGVELPPSVACRLSGALLHRKAGKSHLNPYPQEMVNVGRNELTQHLVDHALSHPSGNIALHFGWTLYALEEEGQVARFRRTKSRQQVAEEEALRAVDGLEGYAGGGTDEQRDFEGYDLLVGADGVWSLVRKELIRFDKEKGLKDADRFVATQVVNRSCYKRLPPLPASALEHPLIAEQPRAIKIWGNPSRAWVLLGPIPGDRHLALLVSSESKGLKLEQLKSAEDVLQLFQAEFPEVLEVYTRAMPDFGQLVAREPVGVGGISTRCSRLHSGRVVLIGDAAHSVYPTLAQGCNAALEDVLVLDQVLAEFEAGGGAGGGGIQAALAEYTARRRADAHAIVDLSQDPPVPGLGGKAALARFLLLKAAHSVAPSLVPKPLAFLPVNTDYSYSEVKSMTTAESRRAAVISASSLAIVVGIGYLTLKYYVKYKRRV